MEPIYDCQKCGHPISHAIVNGETVLVKEYEWDEETDERIHNEWNECPACGTQDWQTCLHPDLPDNNDDRVDELMEEFCKPCPLCFEWECSRWADHCFGCHRNFNSILERESLKNETPAIIKTLLSLLTGSRNNSQ